MSNVKSKVFTAPRCRIMVDAKIIGFGTNVTVNVANEYGDVDCIDSIETLEFVPLGYKVNGSIANVGLVGTTYKTMGIVPRTGKDADEHLLNMLQQPEHVLVLMDKPETRNLVTIVRVQFGDHGFTVNAGAISGRNISWKAIRETDESEM